MAMSPDQREQPQETLDRFNFKFPGEVEKFIYCRPVRRSRPRKSDTEGGLATVRFELKTYDPRMYAAAVTNSGSQSGTFNINNGGDAVAHPLINMSPSAGAVRVVNNLTGDEFEVLSGAGTGSGFVFDSQRFIQGRGDLLIVYRGTTNHYGLWETPRHPFRLLPGDNSCQLSTGVSVAFTYYDTWM